MCVEKNCFLLLLGEMSYRCLSGLGSCSSPLSAQKKISMFLTVKGVEGALEVRGNVYGLNDSDNEWDGVV